MKNSDDTTCLNLAREGERLIRENNFTKGIEFLERAIDVGTGDLQTLSAIYSQLGNAFFSIRSYSKALEYHNNDLLLARLMADKMGEAKACGNLGNTWKALGGFNDAIMFIERQLELARQLGDKMLEARALFHLGTSYQMRGKQLGKRLKSTNLNSSVLSLNMSVMQPFTEDLEKSIVHFKENLRLSEELCDELACGRIYGHLGNTYYLLREYETAINYHYKRLDTARQFGDKNAMRRAYSNLGNAHVFLPNMEKAIEFYRLALSLSYELRDKLAEAQSCFSLANAAALVADYRTAAEYHTRHLQLARECVDRAGEARAYASLAVDYRNIGDLQKSAYFFLRNRKVAKEMSDVGMIEAANDGLRDLLREGGSSLIEDGEFALDWSADPDGQPLRLSASLHSLYDEVKDHSDCGLSRHPAYRSEGDLNQSEADNAKTKSNNALSQEEFFDMLSRFQSKRLDEQRCDPTILSDVTNRSKGPRQTDTLPISPNDDPRLRRRRSLIGRITHSVFQPLHSSTPLIKRFPSVRHIGRSRQNSTMNQSHDALTVPKLVLDQSALSAIDRDEAADITLCPSSAGSDPSDVVNDMQFKPPKVPAWRRLSLPAISLKRPERNNGPDAIIDLIINAQARRMDEQRANLLLPGLHDREGLLNKLSTEQRGHSELEGDNDMDDHFYEMVLRSQSERINEQRSELGGRTPSTPSSTQDSAISGAVTIPEDDITALVMRMQAGRIDEQRAHLHQPKNSA